MGHDIDIQLIRHGEAAARWDTARDPPLSEQGRGQAETLVASFAHIAPRRILTSPQLRAQETAHPLAQSWHAPVNIADEVRELPSSVPLAERAESLGFDSVWAGDSLLARPRHDQHPDRRQGADPFHRLLRPV